MRSLLRRSGPLGLSRPAYNVPILSRIGPAPLVAYSAARKLRTGYAGSALRVRRSNDDAELDIGFTASGLLDTAALLAHTGANSGYITTLYDQSSTATQGLVLPGTTGNNVTVPDQSTFTPSTSVDARAVVTMAAVSGQQAVMGMWSAAGQKSWLFTFDGTSQVFLYRSTDGTAAALLVSGSAATFTLNTPICVRVTADASSSTVWWKAGSDVSSDTGWTTITAGGAALGTVFNATSTLMIGQQQSSYSFSGTFHRAYLKVDGNVVLDVDFTTPTVANATSFVCSTGQVVTVNRSAASPSAFIGSPTPAVQATKANQPRIVNAGTIDTYGGRPCPRYRPAAETHHLDATISVADATFSAVAVVASATTGSNALGRLLSLGVAAADDSSGTASWALFTKTSTSLSTTKDSTNDTMSVTADTAVVVSTVADGTNQTTKRNGTNSALSPYAKATSFTISKLVLGSKVTDGTVPAAGGVGDVLIFADALADVDRLTVERDLGAFYGVVVQ